MSRSSRRFVLAVTPAVVLAALLAAPAVGAERSETHTFSSATLEVANLIGAVRVEPSPTGAFEVTVHVRGADATAERVRIDKAADRLAVIFPLEESRHYRYPALGRGETTISFGEDEGWLTALLGGLLGRDRLEVSGGGSGLELWADLTVRVPRGARLSIDHGVGAITADGVEGQLELDTRAGSVEVSDVRGSLSVDTGSGGVTVRGVEGPVTLDTGSGRVELERARGDDIVVDTGSGSVRVADIDGRRLVLDTGSGRIEADKIRAESATLDTGSGSVRLQLDRMGSGAFEVDTGSGSIELVLPRDAVAEIGAQTGSGRVVVDLDGSAEVRRDEDEHAASVRIGTGSGARVTLDSGSGSIRISY